VSLADVDPDPDCPTPGTGGVTLRVPCVGLPVALGEVELPVAEEPALPEPLPPPPPPCAKAIVVERQSAVIKMMDFCIGSLQALPDNAPPQLGFL
jgi:hypothetical protein